MSAFYIVEPALISWASGDVYITCAGTVRAPHGAGVARVVEVFNDTCNTPLNRTVSTLPHGAFTMQVMAFETTPLTVICRGVDGENSTIDSHCIVI